MKNRPLIVIGAGGHAKVLIDALQIQKQKRELLGVVDADLSKHGIAVLGVELLGTEEIILEHRAGDVELVNGVGSVSSMDARATAFERWRGRSYTFATVVHPSAIVARSAELASGVQVMAGAVIQAESVVSENTIVNTRASIDHDCVIGAHCHVAPGATLSGGVRVGERTHIGVGACVVQGVVIGSRCLIAAGAVVVKDVADGTVVRGVPARVG
jgi:sugar O-acyltransferase (sialic acid O-acetyltransferase NeuD family)